MAHHSLAVLAARAGARRLNASARNGRFRARPVEEPAHHAPFLAITQGSLSGRQEIASPRCVIGRAPDAHIVLQDPHVSRRHASIELRGEVYVLQDLKSRNGTILNDQRVEAATLFDGDVIRIGHVRLVFREPR